MILTYADGHKWQKTATADPLDHFGKNSIARIKSTLNKINDLNISTEIKPVDQDFIDWFVPKYEERINSKSNPRVFDIAGKTLHAAQKAFYSLVLFEGEERLGATIFSISKSGERFSIAYRTYANSWTNAKLQANPSLYTEYAICKYAYEQGCSQIIHGKDKNPYGINSNIGLGAFKLAAGCQPQKCKSFELDTIDTDTLETDALIFEFPGDDQVDIKKGYLVTSRETADKWMQVTKYPHLVEIETIYRD